MFWLLFLFECQPTPNSFIKHEHVVVLQWCIYTVSNTSNRTSWACNNQLHYQNIPRNKSFCLNIYKIIIWHYFTSLVVDGCYFVFGPSLQSHTFIFFDNGGIQQYLSSATTSLWRTCWFLQVLYFFLYCIYLSQGELIYSALHLAIFLYILNIIVTIPLSSIISISIYSQFSTDNSKHMALL